MSEAVQIQIIISIQIVIVAFIGGNYLQTLRVKKHAKEAASQSTESAKASGAASIASSKALYEMTNDHKENFREEGDKRHQEINSKLTLLAGHQVSMMESIEKLEAGYKRNRNRIADIEDTMPKTVPVETYRGKHKAAVDDDV